MQIAYKPVRNLLAFLIIVVILYFLFGKWSNHMDDNIDKEYQLLYKTALHDVIEAVSVKYHTTSFKLIGNSHEFVVFDETNYQLNDGKTFYSVASKGDSIVKQADSDILFLIKKGKKYKYRFKNGY